MTQCVTEPPLVDVDLPSELRRGLRFTQLLSGEQVTTYRIEPGDWECATGESVDSDVVVRKVQCGDIDAALLMDLGFDEIDGKADCWEIEAEWGYLQVWMWESGLEWFVAGETLAEDGPKNEDDLRQFMRILGFKESSR